MFRNIKENKMANFILYTDSTRFNTVANCKKFMDNLNKDKQWEITIEPYKHKRSNRQNRLYWEWLTIIGKEIGYDKEELHDIFRRKFLPVNEVEVLGVTHHKLTSTSCKAFTTEMMMDYMERIDRFAAQDLGIILPHPI